MTCIFTTRSRLAISRCTPLERVAVAVVAQRRFEQHRFEIAHDPRHVGDAAILRRHAGTAACRSAAYPRAARSYCQSSAACRADRASRGRARPASSARDAPRCLRAATDSTRLRRDRAPLRRIVGAGRGVCHGDRTAVGRNLAPRRHEDADGDEREHRGQRHHVPHRPASAVGFEAPPFRVARVRRLTERAGATARVEAAHEPGPVAGRRRIDGGPLGQRAADGVQIVEPLAAGRAAAQVGGRAGAIRRDPSRRRNRGRRRESHARHARPPVVTRALASAPRRRWTAACSCRFTVPSARFKRARDLRQLQSLMMPHREHQPLPRRQPRDLRFEHLARAGRRRPGPPGPGPSSGVFTICSSASSVNGAQPAGDCRRLWSMHAFITIR